MENRIDWRALANKYPSYEEEIYRKRKNQIGLAVLAKRLGSSRLPKVVQPVQVGLFSRFFGAVGGLFPFGKSDHQ